MSAGTFTLSPEARLRDEKGEVCSRDVQAVFIEREVTLKVTDTVVELIVQAEPHVELIFEWVDRRREKGQPVSYYGEFTVTGFMPQDGSKPTWWRGETERILRDGREVLMVKVPRRATELSLALPADQRVTASYQDADVQAGPGHVKLGDVTDAKQRTIFGDEPRRE